MTEEYGLMSIDATLPISVQQQQVRRYVEPLIEDTMEAGGQTVPEALGSAGLSGRYITEPPRRRLTEQDVLRQGSAKDRSCVSTLASFDRFRISPGKRGQ